MNNGINGHWVAAATPLTEAGTVDGARLAAHAEWLFGYGVRGLVLFGTTGEGTSFSARERLDTVTTLLQSGIAPDRIALGAGFPAIADSAALCRDALALGIRDVLILPPYFYRDAPPDGLETAFATILDTVADDRLRALLYHIPQTSGVAIPPAVLANLRRRFGPIVAGLKDSSADFAQFQAFRAAAPDCAITVGNEADIARALAEGGVGTICGMSNLVPDLVAAMFDGDAGTGAMKGAIALMQGPFVPTMKAALAELTGEPAWSRVRAPLMPASAETGKRVATGLRALRQPAAA